MTRRTLGVLLRFAALAVLGGLLAACTPTPSIRDIVDHPRDYADKRVAVKGEVKDVYSLLVVRYFTLAQDGAEIGVVTERPLPRRGEHIRVSGVVKEAFSFGDRSTLMLMEDPPAKEGGPPAR